MHIYNGGYFSGNREGKESYIIIVGVWPLNVLRDILLLGSSHQHHCKHTHPPTPHIFHYHHLCCHYQYHPNQYNHHIIIYSIIITVASPTIIFQSKPTFVKEDGIEEAGNEGGGMGETPVGEKEIISAMTA